MTRKELEELKARSDADLARTRAEPEYAQVLADVRAEVDSADLTRSIIDGSHLTQAEIARRMDVSQPYIAQLRKGRNATLPTLFRLARACGVSLRISAAAL